MFMWLYQICKNERGVQTMEWLGLGTVILMMIGSVYTALDYSNELRATLTRTTDAYALHFGRDIVVFGPPPPEFADAIAYKADALWSTRQPVVFDPQTNEYVFFDSQQDQQMLIRPADEVLVESNNGQLTLIDSTQQQSLVIDHGHRKVYLTDMATQLQRLVTLNEAQQLGFIAIQPGE
ncbi:MAG: hypothetical protein GFH27_549309n73 [Chloroflexi bacterium AL-W]|nr:hypothetical protein [Chloroflexi bacterium AL-N1]NOK69776.1 hypothetical protein [Chloroflexi bacterium AL-N10]NOK73620.1 hypothetical protein [Chloroflexi bacterium AL-N5]NOK83946.1 hypothetical protein [Chloroflexi bacterium AL-W]NOK87951.1 hypothetical protein [Chloroflexi bacterium AL-N15]